MSRNLCNLSHVSHVIESRFEQPEGACLCWVGSNAMLSKWTLKHAQSSYLIFLKASGQLLRKDCGLLKNTVRPLADRFFSCYFSLMRQKRENDSEFMTFVHNQRGSHRPQLDSLLLKPVGISFF